MTLTFKNARRVVTNTGSVVSIELDFKAEEASTVHLYAGEPGTVELTQGVHYTLSGLNTDALTATLVNPAAWGAYSKFALYVEYIVDQPNDVDVGGPFGQRFETALDRIMLAVQSMYDKVQRSVKMPITGPVGADNFLVPQPNQLIGWNADGSALESKPQISESVEVALQAAATAVEAAADAWEAVNSIDLTQYYTKTQVDASQASQNTDINTRALKATTVSATGLATGGGDLSANRTVTVTKSTNAQALAGVDDTTAMTPVRTKEAIAANAPALYATFPVAVTLAVNTSRTPSTTKATEVTISMPSGGSAAILKGGFTTVVGSQAALDFGYNDNTTYGGMALRCVIPPNGSYSYTIAPGSPAITVQERSVN